MKVNDIWGCLRATYVLSVVTVGFLGIAYAQSTPSVVGKDEIIQALKPKPKTRSLGRNLVVEVAPSVSLTIGFEFDSAKLSAGSRLQLEQLSAALRSDDLSSLQFRIEGHTDATGKVDYNQKLSERRAEAVKTFLVSQGLAPAGLRAIGKGSSDLLDPNAPTSGVNRRVKIVTALGD